jgi:hypothetical protein
MVIDEAVWQTWREREGAFKKPSIALLLVAATPPETTVAVLAECLRDVMEPRIAKADAAAPGEEEFRTGAYSYVRVPQGVVLRIDEGPDDFEELLRGIAEGLMARGIEGGIALYEPEGLAEVPELIDLFECHLRLNGELVDGRRASHSTRRPPLPLWAPEPGALATAAEAGIAWCLGNDPQVPLSLAVHLLPPFVVGPDDDVRGYVDQAIAQTSTVGVARLTSAAPDRFRTFAIHPLSGRVGLIEGGAAAKKDWQASVRHLTAALREWSLSVVYAFVKRGSRLTDAVLGSSLPSDWLDVPHMNALAFERQAFEDRFVPDAFGIQLLSAGHGAHFPHGPSWQIERLGQGRSLVEHVDAAAWFDGSLVRFGGHPNPFYDPFPRTPDLLTRAREDFDAILYKDGGPAAWEKELGERRFTS